mmetsp:Transcript_106296/g.189013  ORF Transcript_106296/g.189013 Transcript_106296/m.189013 type:complete len:83 (+) Transcript_106296:121-369(+)
MHLPNSVTASFIHMVLEEVFEFLQVNLPIAVGVCPPPQRSYMGLLYTRDCGQQELGEHHWRYRPSTTPAPKRFEELCWRLLL